MPVPRLFTAYDDPRAQWSHTLASLLALTGPDTRGALVAELVGEELEGAEGALVRERRPVPGGGLVDVVAHAPDRSWVVAMVTSLAFGGDRPAAVAAAADSVKGMAPRVIALTITADRKPPAVPGGDGLDARHKSWLRVRDWVQERPERGGSQGVDLLLLREAEYVLTPRVAELYRLEELAPMVPEGLRETLAAVYFDLEALHPAPLIETAGGARIAFPRTGEARVEVLVQGGGLHVAVATDLAGPGYEGDPRPGWSRTTIAEPGDWAAARSWTLATAADLLPPLK